LRVPTSTSTRAAAFRGRGVFVAGFLVFAAVFLGLRAIRPSPDGFHHASDERHAAKSTPVEIHAEFF
jgi:hypothetical protein